jgi:hypothetical protein
MVLFYFILFNNHNQQLQLAGDFLYCNPPVQQYGTLQWMQFENIEAVGYAHMNKLLHQWRAEQRLPAVAAAAFTPAAAAKPV